MLLQVQRIVLRAKVKTHTGNSQTKEKEGFLKIFEDSGNYKMQISLIEMEQEHHVDIGTRVSYRRYNFEEQGIETSSTLAKAQIKNEYELEIAPSEAPTMLLRHRNELAIEQIDLLLPLKTKFA